MMRHEFPAMGTRIVTMGEDPAAVVEFFAWAESVLSRFGPDSELSRVNADPEVEVLVSDTLAGCLDEASYLRKITDGLVDPAVGNAVVGWGYDRSFVDGLDREAADLVQAIGQWEINGNVVHRRPGVLLDLGGIAKGWVADQAVSSGLATMVSAGGDMRSNLPDTVVAIEDPWGQVAAQVSLGCGGLATSSSTRRRWKVGGADAHHIIDPRRLAPADSPVFSATVSAATAAQAEAGAKAVLLHGEYGLVWAEQQGWIDAALVVWHDGNVFATSGWEMAA